MGGSRMARLSSGRLMRLSGRLCRRFCRNLCEGRWRTGRASVAARQGSGWWRRSWERSRSVSGFTWTRRTGAGFRFPTTRWIPCSLGTLRPTARSPGRRRFCLPSQRFRSGLFRFIRRAMGTAGTPRMWRRLPMAKDRPMARRPNQGQATLDEAKLLYAVSAKRPMHGAPSGERTLGLRNPLTVSPDGTISIADLRSVWERQFRKHQEAHRPGSTELLEIGHGQDSDWREYEQGAIRCPASVQPW